MIRRPPRSTLSSSSAASDVYKRQVPGCSAFRHLVISGTNSTPEVLRKPCPKLCVFRYRGQPGQLLSEYYPNWFCSDQTQHSAFVFQHSSRLSLLRKLIWLPFQSALYTNRNCLKPLSSGFPYLPFLIRLSYPSQNLPCFPNFLILYSYPWQVVSLLLFFLNHFPYPFRPFHLKILDSLPGSSYLVCLPIVQKHQLQMSRWSQSLLLLLIHSSPRTNCSTQVQVQFHACGIQVLLPRELLYKRPSVDLSKEQPIAE